MTVERTPPVQPRKSGTIIHIGAGFRDRIAEFLEWNPKQLILVESDPGAYLSARQRVQNIPNARVINAGIARKTGYAILNRYNLPGVANFQGAAPNHDLFPGLHVTQQTEVDVLSPADLLSGCELEEGQGNRLVIDTIGDEENVVIAFSQDGLLTRFDYLEVRVSANLFGRPGSGDLIVDCATKNQFDISRIGATSDGLSSWCFERRVKQLHIDDLKNRLIERDQVIDELRARLTYCSEQESRIEELTARLEERDEEVTKLTENLCRQSEHIIALRESMERGEQQCKREKDLRDRLEQEIGRAEAQLALLGELIHGDPEGSASSQAGPDNVHAGAGKGQAAEPGDTNGL